MRDLPDDNLQYPVLISNTQGGSGSGFYLIRDKRLYLVTALHVLYKDGELIDDRITLLSYDRDPKKPAGKLEVDLNKTQVRFKKTKDIILVELGKTTEEESGFITYSSSVRKLTDQAWHIVSVPANLMIKFSEVLVANEVFVLGYPNSIGIVGDSPQIDYERPLLRKGVIAGLNHKNQTIVLDCPVYFGNSGGLAIQVTQTSPGEYEYRTIGVVSQFVPFIEQLVSPQLNYINTNVENSGYSIVVPTDTIFELSSEKPKTISQNQ